MTAIQMPSSMAAPTSRLGFREKYFNYEAKVRSLEYWSKPHNILFKTHSESSVQLRGKDKKKKKNQLGKLLNVRQKYKNIGGAHKM